MELYFMWSKAPLINLNEFMSVPETFKTIEDSHAPMTIVKGH